jgi:hypothetical protein
MSICSRAGERPFGLGEVCAGRRSGDTSERLNPSEPFADLVPTSERQGRHPSYSPHRPVDGRVAARLSG